VRVVDLHEARDRYGETLMKSPTWLDGIVFVSMELSTIGLFAVLTYAAPGSGY
jgi:hypothetical protein